MQFNEPRARGSRAGFCPRPRPHHCIRPWLLPRRRRLAPGAPPAAPRSPRGGASSAHFCSYRHRSGSDVRSAPRPSLRQRLADEPHPLPVVPAACGLPADFCSLGSGLRAPGSAWHLHPARWPRPAGGKRLDAALCPAYCFCWSWALPWAGATLVSTVLISLFLPPAARRATISVRCPLSSSTLISHFHSLPYASAPLPASLIFPDVLRDEWALSGSGRDDPSS